MGASCNLICDGSHAMSVETGVDSIRDNDCEEGGEFAVDSIACYGFSCGAIALVDCVVSTTDEPLTSLATVVPVEGLIATNGAVESWAKESDCTDVTVAGSCVNGAVADEICDSTIAYGSMVAFGGVMA